MTAPGSSVHASAVLVGDRAVVIRGPSGSGKSRLAFDLILAGRARQIASAVLVGDDRVLLEAVQRELVVRPARGLEGLIEIRGLGIRRCDFALQAVVGLVVDLSAQDADRMPSPEPLVCEIAGIKIPRIPVGSGFQPLPLVLAALSTRPSDDCPKGIGNHISPTIATQ
ncbi:MAG TPA: HPr kinase/phosphatase C-terminal domain-containing protein [Bradyrhizobium sp.]|nr:HPr kinase/phosphatase C-terminal domain-containing protein [Bradyrhizobium sp.]